MSRRFLSDVYETEEWTRLDFGSYVDHGTDDGGLSMAVIQQR
jgi:hypothetical protein